MGILLDITFYSVIHHNPLHITQLANHPKCSIIYTNYPVYTYVHYFIFYSHTCSFYVFTNCLMSSLLFSSLLSSSNSIWFLKCSMSPSYDCKVEIFSTTNSLSLYGLNSTPFPVRIAEFQSATSPGVFTSQPDYLYGQMS